MSHCAFCTFFFLLVLFCNQYLGGEKLGGFSRSVTESAQAMWSRGHEDVGNDSTMCQVSER